MPAYRDPGLLTFSAPIQQGDSAGAGAYVHFPFDLKDTFGVGNLVPLVATIDGLEYRGSLAKMGRGPILIVLKEIRERLGKSRGDTVQVSVRLDTAPRTIDPPEDLLSHLREQGLEEPFTRMAVTHQREYVRWIEEAKRPETRQRRVLQTAEKLREKLGSVHP